MSLCAPQCFAKAQRCLYICQGLQDQWGIPYWNQGYMTEAARTLVQYGFQELKLNRVEATHYKNNPASGRVMQKIGMQQEGVRRQQTLRFGQFEDCVVYGLLASDDASSIYLR